MSTFASAFGMWRSWLAHLLWEQGVLRSSRSIPTKKGLIVEIEPFLFIYLAKSGAEWMILPPIVINMCYSGANMPILPPNGVNCSYFGAEEPVLSPSVNGAYYFAMFSRILVSAWMFLIL